MDRPEPSKARLNWKAVAGLSAILVLGIGGYFLTTGVQGGRLRGEALAQARRLEKAGDVDQAVRHLNSYLKIAPDDLEILGLRARLLAASARSPGDILVAAEAQDQVLRKDPDGKDSQEGRRRLAELYILYSDFVQESKKRGRTSPERAAEFVQYRAAVAVAREAIRRGADDPAAHRLLAMALEGLTRSGDSASLPGAIREYQSVLRSDPGDIVAAGRLALLARELGGDPDLAERVLADLLRARADSPIEARLVRSRHFAQIPDPTRATAELTEAIRVDPANLAVRIDAAGDAIQRGSLAEAQRHLDAIPADAREDIRVRTLAGTIALGQDRPDEAIAAWRTGLAQLGGTDATLTGRLAYILLELGRVAEARPLLAQYERLVGDKSNEMGKMLHGLLDARTGHPTRAIATLERARDKVGPEWLAVIETNIARCAEALGDEPGALAAFNRASTASGRGKAARIAAATFLIDRRPNAAIAELEEGLKEAPGDPDLTIALARARVRRQAQLPVQERSWTEVDAALDRAAAVAPAEPELNLARAERLALTGDLAAAQVLLEAAAAKAPGRAAIWTAWANLLAKANRPDRALTILDRASEPKAAGDRAGFRIARAELLTTLGRGREAAQALGRDIAKLPSDQRALVWQALGRLQIARGELDDARRTYAEWAAYVPEDPRPRLAELELVLDSGDRQAARALVDGLKGNEATGDVLWRLARAAELLRSPDVPEGRQARLDEVSRLVDTIAAETPGLPDGYLLRARLRERQGQLDEAAVAYREAWDHGIPAGLTHLIDVLVRLKRFNELAALPRGTNGIAIDKLAAQSCAKAGQASWAAIFVDRVVRARPDDLAVRGWQARMLKLTDRPADSRAAEATLRAAADLRPNDPEAWLALLQFQVAAGRAADTPAAIEKILKLVKTDRPELLEGRCRHTVGDRAGADRAYAAALAARPDDVETLMTAATYYEATGRASEVESALRKALALAPDRRDAARRLALLLSARTGDAEAWREAWEVLGVETPGVETHEDRLARGIVLARSADPARRNRAIDDLEALASDLPIDSLAGIAARDQLVASLRAAGRDDRAARVAAVSAASGADAGAVASYAETLIGAKRLDEAAVQLDRLATLSPGDLREAILAVRLVRARAEAGGDAASALERAYLERGDRPGAVAFGREAVVSLIRDGDKAGPAAEALARKLAGRDPASAWLLARALIRAGRHGEALAPCQQAVDAGAGDDVLEAAAAAYEVASSADSPEVLDRADAVLEAAVRREPTRTEIRAVLAMLRHMQNRIEEEIALCRSIVADRPDDAFGLNNLAWALCEGVNRPAEALPFAEDLVRRHGQVPGSLDTRGVILTRLGRHADAIRDLKAATDAQPTAGRLFHLARAYRADNQPEEASKTLDRARKAGLDPAKLEPNERTDYEAMTRP